MKTWKYLTILTLMLLAGGCNLGTPTEATGGGTGVEGLTGALVTPSGVPAVGAQVRLYAVPTHGGQLAKTASVSSSGDAAADSAVATATVSATGSFLFKDLADGTYNVAATFKSGDTTLSVFVRGVVVAGNTNLGTDTLRVSGGLSVQIRAGASALPGATCMIPASPWQAVSDSTGTCVLTGLPPGTFKIVVSYPGLVLFVSGNLSVSSGTVANAGTITLPGSPGPVDTLRPPAPTLIYPYTGNLNLPASPTFFWDSIPRATGYHFQLVGSNFPTIPVADDSTLTTSSRVAGPLEYLVGYSWRVRARNAAGWGAWSAYVTFMRDEMPSVPGTPVLTSPTHNATGLSTTPTFIWSQLGATSYHLQIHTDSTFINPVKNDTVPQSDAAVALVSRTVGPLNANTIYYWRVRGVNTGGVGTWSEVRRFTTTASDSSSLPATPVPTSPAQFATGLSRTPSLTWNLAIGASTYHLQVHTSATFINPLVNDTLGPTLPAVPFVNITLDSLANNTTYYWRVRSSNSAGASAWSEIRQFSVGSAASPPDTATPSAPTLASPAAFVSNLSTTPTLTWNASATATSYDVQVSTATTFSTTVFTETGTTGTSRILPALANNTSYYWRVRGRNAAGAGGWSEIRVFTVGTVASSPGDTIPPATPTLLTPEQFATNVATTPTLTWSAATRAASYDIQVSTSTTFATLVVNDTAVTATSRTLAPLAASTDYYWRVRARNAVGTSAFATTRRFTTGTGP